MVINRSKEIVDPTLGGKGLSAQADLKAGDLIIKVADPFLLIVENASLNEVCSQCFRKEQDCCQENQKLAACLQCGVPRYCSEDCQASSWNSVHGLECRALKALKDQGKMLPTPTRALMQILLMHKLKDPSLAPDSGWKDLISNLDHLRSTSRWSDILLQVQMACHLAQLPLGQASYFATEVFCRMSTNAFRVMPVAFDKPVGLCFEPVMALPNHSCTPNAIIVFDGRKAMLRALNPIKKDEQIFISYINNTERRETRQSSLQDGYFFICNCIKCSEDRTPYALWKLHHMQFSTTTLDALFYLEHDVVSPASEAEIAIEKLAAAATVTERVYTDVNLLLNTEADSAYNKDHRLQAITRAFGTLRVFWQAEIFAQPPYPTLLSRLYLHHIDNENYPAALSILIFTHLRCNVYTHPQLHHPSNIAHLLAIADLCIGLSLQATADDPEPASISISFPSVDFLSAAQIILILLRRLVPLSHGQKSAPMDTVKRLMASVEEGQRGPGRAGEALTRWGNGGPRPPLVSMVLSQLRSFGGKAVVEKIIALGLPAVVGSDPNFELF